MSVSYYAFACLGIPIAQSDVEDESFYKQDNEGDDEYCSDGIYPDGSIEGIPIKWNSLNEGMGYIGHLLGGNIEGGDSFWNISTDELIQARKDIKAVLEPLGLWEESQFGLHVWGDASV